MPLLEALDLSKGAPSLLSCGATDLSVHPKYIISDAERQSLKQVHMLSYVPTLDLHELDGPSRSQATKKLKEACKEYGFFEVYKITTAHLY